MKNQKTSVIIKISAIIGLSVVLSACGIKMNDDIYLCQGETKIFYPKVDNLTDVRFESNQKHKKEPALFDINVKHNTLPIFNKMVVETPVAYADDYFTKEHGHIFNYDKNKKEYSYLEINKNGKTVNEFYFNTRTGIFTSFHVFYMNGTPETVGSFSRTEATRITATQAVCTKK